MAGPVPRGLLPDSAQADGDGRLRVGGVDVLGLADFMPSRLFIYFNERRMEGTINSDAGAMIRDGIKSVNKMGVCSEIEWPYRIKDFAKQPPAKVYDDARFHQIG